MNNEKTTDPRQLLELINEWYKAHGFSLQDGTRRKQVLVTLAKTIDNPIASQLTPKTLTDYRYNRMQTITAKTANNEMSYLNAMFNKLRKLRIIDYPCPS